MRPIRFIDFRSLGICTTIAVGASLGILAPAAMAAPANDAFANRTSLGDELPVNLTESNAGATAQEGELIPSDGIGFAAGHSVWWEWEAPRSEVVSIGSCGSDFTTKLGVFTGETFPLSPLPASTGPECDAQKTFAAAAGTRYDIGVDGYTFDAPGETPPPSEGTIALRIAALPPPPNDSFASPGSIQQIIWVSPSGARRMLGDTSGGYNWGATSEPGEPVHAGVGGGASIWYSFVAPGAGNVIVSTGDMNETDHPVLAVYTGSSVTALTPIVSAAEAGRGASFTAEAGQEFRIAVDGQADAEGIPWMGSIDLVLSEELPPGTGNASGAPEWDAASDTPLPTVKPVTSAPPAAPQMKGRSIDARTETASFRFASATRGVQFRCSLDRGPFRGCVSPLKLRHLHPGPHRLGIVSVLRGRPASAPSVVHFAITAPQRRHHGAS